MGKVQVCISILLESNCMVGCFFQVLSVHLHIINSIIHKIDSTFTTFPHNWLPRSTRSSMSMLPFNDRETWPYPVDWFHVSHAADITVCRVQEGSSFSLLFGLVWCYAYIAVGGAHPTELISSSILETKISYSAVHVGWGYYPYLQQLIINTWIHPTGVAPH